jgi:hypothetical protein
VRFIARDGQPNGPHSDTTDEEGRFKVEDLRGRIFHNSGYAATNDPCGAFYMPLTDFPAAYADLCGYVVFSSEVSFSQNRYLDDRGSSINPRVGIPNSLKNMPGYVRKRS